MIAGNYSNNFQYVPEWLWDKHISPVQFTVYMALRSFSYPTGPTIEMLAAKTGFDPGVVLETVHSLEGVGLAEPCATDEYGRPCDDRWRFCYLKYTKDAPDRAPAPPPDNLTPAVLTSIYGEEDWSATIRKVDEEAPEETDNVVPFEAPRPDRDRMAGLT